MREWILMRLKYGIYEKVMKHLRESDEKSFKNFVKVDLELFNEMVEDLGPRLQKRETNFRKPLSTGLKLAITLRYLATGDNRKQMKS